MINCCIEKKLARESKLDVSHTASPSINPDKLEAKDNAMSVDDSESEDEFFECNATSADEDVDASQCESTKPHPKSEIPIWSRDAEGRQHRFGKLKLVEHDDWLYVPVCQDPTPMTEDMLAEQAEVRYYVNASEVE